MIHQDVERAQRIAKQARRSLRIVTRDDYSTAAADLMGTSSKRRAANATREKWPRIAAVGGFVRNRSWLTGNPFEPQLSAFSQ